MNIIFELNILLDESSASDKLNLSVFYDLNDIIQESHRHTNLDECFKNIKGHDRHFWFYKGGNHIAVHQKIEGETSSQRILFITEK